MLQSRRYQDKIYKILSGEENAISIEDEEGLHLQTIRKVPWYVEEFVKYRIFAIWNFALLLWTGILLYQTLSFVKFAHSDGNSLAIYSPIPDKIIQYERANFNQAIYGERTIYMGGSKEANESWTELVEHGVIKLDKITASKLHDKTVPFLEEDGYYFASVELWHQLHCMNAMRKRLWAETPTSLFGKDPESWEVQHLEHCIDILRQTLICHGDTGIIPFRFSSNSTYYPLFNSTRVYKKYEPLRDWVDAWQAGDDTPEGVKGIVHTHTEGLLGNNVVKLA